MFHHARLFTKAFNNTLAQGYSAIVIDSDGAREPVKSAKQVIDVIKNEELSALVFNKNGRRFNLQFIVDDGCVELLDCSYSEDTNHPIHVFHEYINAMEEC